MASTTNKDLDYIQKDFSSSVDALVNYATVNYGSNTSANRLWTSFNVDSFSRTWLELVAYIADVFYFYFDNQATQTYLQTATVRSAVKDIAKQFGFVPATATSASGVATFTVNAAGTIPRGFRLGATNGEEFYLTNDVIAGAAGDYEGTVLQGIIKSEQFVANGLQNEEFNLSALNVIVDLNNINAEDISPTLTVSGNDYTLVDSFIRHNGTDTDAVKDSLGNIIGGGGRVFTLNERQDGTKFIRFGDGIFGRKLAPGEIIDISYRANGGSSGNIAEETLIKLIDSNPIVTSVTNNAAFSGGSDEQLIDELRELIPASLRTLQRAVSQQDYSDILISNFSEVFDATTALNTVDPGIDINIYVIPKGIAISKISENVVLKNNLSTFIDRRKTVTTQFQILDAFGINCLITLEVYLSATASKAKVKENLENALQQFFDLNNGGPEGTGIGFSSYILLKDIGNVVEAISGIERYEIKELSYRPRIIATAIEAVTSYTNSDVSIFNNVEELEWLVGASGIVPETPGTTLFLNSSLVSFTYNSLTGVIQYATLVDLTKVATGDLFKDGAGASFQILAVDVLNNYVVLTTGLSVNTTVSNSTHGSIVNGVTSYESFKCFKKINALATNLSLNSITDSNLDLSVINSSATATSSRVLLDNTKVFVPNFYSNGSYFLVDSSNNVWNIVSNDSNTLTVSVTAINDPSISSVSSGEYKIVKNFSNKDVVFSDIVSTIQYNTQNTIFSVGAQFSNIGTIGDSFQISEEQSNTGALGIGLDLISYDSGTGSIRLNQSPDLDGVSAEWDLVDSEGTVFNIVGVDNRAQPATEYVSANQDSEYVLKGTGLGTQLSQGFQVPSTDVYSTVSFYLKKEGNIVGNLVAKITADSAGLPDLSSILAVSNSVSVSSVDNSNFLKVSFYFLTPPTLNTSTQYHLVLSGDTAYTSSEASEISVFSNTGLVAFTYNAITGVIQYASEVDLSAVLPNQYFKDNSLNLFKILSVDDTANTVTLSTGLTVNNTVSSASDGSIIKNDRVLLAADSSSPTYASGNLSQFDGFTWFSVATVAACFSVEGTKFIKINSDLQPKLGTGATVSKRYYDDNNQISFVLGLSSGIVTSASDVNALGKGTVGAVPNSFVDNFVFRTSNYSDDIVNLRANEVPQLQTSDVVINVLGGID